MTGALMAFGVGLLYAWTQTIFGYLMKPSMVARTVHHIRLVLCILGAIFFVTSEWSRGISYLLFNLVEATGFSENKPATYKPENSNTTTQIPWGHWPSDAPVCIQTLS